MKRGNKITFPGTDFKMEYHAKPEFEHPDDDTWNKKEEKVETLFGERLCVWCTVKDPCSECPERHSREHPLTPEQRYEEFIHGKKEKNHV